MKKLSSLALATSGSSRSLRTGLGPRMMDATVQSTAWFGGCAIRDIMVMCTAIATLLLVMEKHGARTHSACGSV